MLFFLFDNCLRTLRHPHLAPPLPSTSGSHRRTPQAAAERQVLTSNVASAAAPGEIHSHTAPGRFHFIHHPAYASSSFASLRSVSAAFSEYPYIVVFDPEARNKPATTSLVPGSALSYISLQTFCLWHRRLELSTSLRWRSPPPFSHVPAEILLAAPPIQAEHKSTAPPQVLNLASTMHLVGGRYQRQELVREGH